MNPDLIENCEMMLVSWPVCRCGSGGVTLHDDASVGGIVRDDNQRRRQQQRITAFLVIIAGSLELKSVLKPFLGSAVEQK